MNIGLKPHFLNVHGLFSRSSKIRGKTRDRARLRYRKLPKSCPTHVITLSGNRTSARTSRRTSGDPAAAAARAADHRDSRGTDPAAQLATASQRPGRQLYPHTPSGGQAGSIRISTGNPSGQRGKVRMFHGRTAQPERTSATKATKGMPGCRVWRMPPIAPQQQILHMQPPASQLQLTDTAPGRHTLPSCRPVQAATSFDRLVGRPRRRSPR